MAPIGNFSGVANTSFSKVDDILVANVNNINDTELITEPVLVKRLVSYVFDNETTVEAAADQWSPTIASIGEALGAGGYPAWFNGATDLPNLLSAPSAANPLWNHPDFSTADTIGWHCGEEGTVSATTAPSVGGATTPTDPDFNNSGAEFSGTQSSTSKYLYTETSTPNNLGTKAFITRLFFGTPTNYMDDTNNTLQLEFWHHAVGTQMGNLYIYSKSDPGGGLFGYAEDPAQATHDNTTLIHTIIGSEANFLGQGSDFQKVTVDLTHIRDAALSLSSPNFHSIYFVYSQNTGYYADFAIDNVSINEVTP